MYHILSSITSDISSRLASLTVALMLANTFLVNAKSNIELLLTWMDSLYHEFQTSDSSSKDAWLLVYYCVRYYFKRVTESHNTCASCFKYVVSCETHWFVYLGDGAITP